MEKGLRVVMRCKRFPWNKRNGRKNSYDLRGSRGNSIYRGRQVPVIAQRFRQVQV